MLPVLALGCGPAIPGARPDSPFVATIRDYLGRAEAAGFSGAVALSRGDQVLLSESVGDLDCAGSRPVLPGTAFYVASLSKAFTAAAVLALEVDGRLGTTDPITRHLPNVPRDKGEITIHHLLTHTSGLDRLPSEVGAAVSDGDAFATALLERPLRTTPGTTYAYSNEGYSLLAAIVQRASGRPFADYLRARIFEPAGMTRTGLVNEPDRWLAQDMARACNGTLDQGDAVLSHHQPLAWGELGATGVVTTAGDLIGWVRALRSGQVLPPEAVDRMFAAQTETYGYGWVYSPRATGRTLLWHDGLLLPEGWNAQLRIYPEQDLTLVVLSNRYDQEPLGWTVARNVDRLLWGGQLVFPPPMEPADPGARLDDAGSLAGLYGSADGRGFFELTHRNGHLELEPRSQAAVNLIIGLAADGNEYLDTANDLTERFLDHAVAGGATAVPIEVSGRPLEEWQPRFESTWDWLRHRFGPERSYQVLHSVPAPFGDPAAITYARLDFRSASTTVRLIWMDERFQSMSDEGAFVGATPAVAVVPAPLGLARTGENRYTGFRLATGVVVEIHVLAGDTGCPRVRVSAPRSRLVVRKVGSC